MSYPDTDGRFCQKVPVINNSSLGLSLTDTLDDLINDGRIEPQLAMKILSTFDKVITEVLAEKVRARLTFKVRYRPSLPRSKGEGRRLAHMGE